MTEKEREREKEEGERKWERGCHFILLSSSLSQQEITRSWKGRNNHESVIIKLIITSLVKRGERKRKKKVREKEERREKKLEERIILFPAERQQNVFGITSWSLFTHSFIPKSWKKWLKISSKKEKKKERNKKRKKRERKRNRKERKITRVEIFLPSDSDSLESDSKEERRKREKKKREEERRKREKKKREEKESHFSGVVQKIPSPFFPLFSSSSLWFSPLFLHHFVYPSLFLSLFSFSLSLSMSLWNRGRKKWERKGRNEKYHQGMYREEKCGRRKWNEKHQLKYVRREVKLGVKWRRVTLSLFSLSLSVFSPSLYLK